MKLVCLDLEGVLIPEIWIAFSKATGIPEFQKTTRDEPDYNALMRFRLDLLHKHSLKLADIQQVIKTIEPLEGALEFANTLREKTQLVILSDTYQEFAKPLMAKLNYPTLFCNSLVYDKDGTITDYRLRQKNGKKEAVSAFKSINIEVFAAGDSYNDLAMIEEAGSGCLFRAPQSIRSSFKEIPCVDSYDDFLKRIELWLNNSRSFFT